MAATGIATSRIHEALNYDSGAYAGRPPSADANDPQSPCGGPTHGQ